MAYSDASRLLERIPQKLVDLFVPGLMLLLLAQAALMVIADLAAPLLLSHYAESLTQSSGFMQWLVFTALRVLDAIPDAFGAAVFFVGLVVVGRGQVRFVIAGAAIGMVTMVLGYLLTYLLGNPAELYPTGASFSYAFRQGDYESYLTMGIRLLGSVVAGAMLVVGFPRYRALRRAQEAKEHARFRARQEELMRNAPRDEGWSTDHP